MKYRIIRENEVQETELTTSSFKKDKIQQTILNVDEEGGIIFEKFENFRVGDIIECYDKDHYNAMNKSIALIKESDIKARN